jgi:hypothetical protein
MMSLLNWIESNATYARKLANSGWEGARRGGEEFLDGEPCSPYLTESARQALIPAAVGTCLGIFGAYLDRRQNRAGRAAVYGVLGGAIGFSAGLLWSTRRLAANAAQGALKNAEAVRDDRWLEKNPINYA